MAKQITSDQALLKEYHTWLRLERGYSPNTVEAYEMDLDKLRAYTAEHSLDYVHLDFEGLEAFIFEQFKTIHSEATQARVLAGIHAWYRFLLYKDYIEQDPSELLEGPRKSKHLPTVLSLDEVNRMMAAIDLSTNEGHRNRAMMEMLYGSGLRVSELVGLQLSKIYLNEHYMLIEGKGSKQRLVPISPVAEEWFGYWLQERATWPVKPEFSRSFGVYAKRQASPRPSAHTRCGTRLRPICSRTAQTCASSSSSLGTKIWPPPRFTHMWMFKISARRYCSVIRRTNRTNVIT